MLARIERDGAAERSADRGAPPGAVAISKVPEVTAWFWIIKVLTTGMGEATSDFLVHKFDPAIVVVPVGIAFAAALWLQFSARKYVPWIYWLAVAMVAVFGTMCADAVHVKLGVPYSVSVAFFGVALAVVFVTWNQTEKTLSVHSIYTPRREAFYWAAVLTTFAFGTALGDWTAVTLNLGYFSSGLLFAALIAIPAIGYRWFGLNAVFAFWFAYIVTRPLGASFADWMGVSHARGGLAWGNGLVSVALAIIIAVLVGYLSLARKEVAPTR